MDSMITTEDLSSYGSSVIEAIEEFMDAMEEQGYYWDPGLFCDEMHKMSQNKAFLIVSTGRRPERRLAAYRSCL